MKETKKQNQTTKFLVVSFIGLLIFSVLVFTVLGVFMSKKSTQAVYEVGNLYMGGIGEQLSKHFETTIELRFEQMDGLAEVVTTENFDTIEDLYTELAYRAQIRKFAYLALCSENGDFETIYGETSIQPLRPEPFLEALNQSEKRVVIGKDANGKDVILFGISVSYPMSDGDSIGLVGAIPLEDMTTVLSLGQDDNLLYCHILRPDGTFVLDGADTHSADYFNSVRSQYREGSHEAVEQFLTDLDRSLQARQNYSASVMDYSGYRRQVYGMPMPYSEWYLLMVMPYGALDQVLGDLNLQRTVMTFVACGIVLVLLSLIFLRYFILTKKQLHVLEEARKTALEATKAKSQFLSNMSHDIRTPMNAIVGMTAVAMTNVDDRDYVQNCLRKIALSGKHLLGLINDVLDMSKIESGKMTLSISCVSLKEIVEEIVGIVQPQINAKKQTFDVHIDNITTEEVLCDSVRLNQVLLNLLSNAVKYTPEGGKISMSMVETESPKGADYVRIETCVKDNGIGMTPEFLENLYESYTRADSARVHKTEGAGLGMAITKYIVDTMGGSIEVQSEVDHGTEFHITLDFEKVEPKDFDMTLPSWNMLVVDDDEMLCKTAAQTLKSIGVKAEFTLSGEEAVKMVVQRHARGDDYQIILLDWKLPSMDGVQTAREIRRELGEEVPILLISAYDWSEFEIEAREAGINGFISKPLFKSTLFYGLKQYMNVDEVSDPESQQETNLAGKRILLAEDNELNWEVAHELLSELNVELEWAEDGQICLDKFSNSAVGYYDAVLMDLRMPVMNGYEATEAIRSLERPDARQIPIIAMTADAFSEDIKHCLEVGMNAHIAKPIDIQEVARILKKYLLDE